MADRKISELTNITGANVDDANDELAIVDSSSSETKAITRAELMSSVSAMSITGDLTVDTDTFYVDSASNRVGINTNSPQNTLDIAGNALRIYSPIGPRIEIEDSNNGFDPSGISVENGGRDFRIFTNQDIIFENNSSESGRFDTSGALLLGTSSVNTNANGLIIANGPTGADVNSAGGNVVIDDGANAGLTILTGNTWNSRVFFADPDNANAGVIEYNHSSDSMAFRTDANEAMRIDSSGNVGIGTSSPTNPLDVNADSVRVRTSQTPTSATAAGNQGEIAWDADYIYVCVATNTWKRTALSTW